MNLLARLQSPGDDDGDVGDWVPTCDARGCTSPASNSVPTRHSLYVLCARHWGYILLNVAVHDRRPPLCKPGWPKGRPRKVA